MKLSAFIMLMSAFVFTGFAQKKETALKKQIYEWRVYTLTGDGAALDSFFKETLIPAYNRYKISVGAFSLYKKEEKEQRYLLFVYPDIQTYFKVKKALENDKAFQNAAQPFLDRTAPNPVYSEYTTYLCEAFDKMPKMRIPDKSRTLFEFRRYHSPNEDANRRKINMFNKGEIDLFDKIDIKSVCYGDILAGADMPALIYLTWYKDETARNKAWETFGNHPDWNRMKNAPEAKNTATSIQIKLLSPMEYSQF
ncbi:MAG: NIPSNAP family protein [Chitinophagaceae bacterium]|jgi:hypothetical protein|nr:NIPSNAP family protein [Chitinophagaceae bacterium]